MLVAPLIEEMLGARSDRIVVRLLRTGGGRLGVTVSPALPPGRVATEAMVDDAPLVPRTSEQMGCRHAEVFVELSDQHEVEIWHRAE